MGVKIENIERSEEEIDPTLLLFKNYTFSFILHKSSTSQIP